MPSPTLPLPRKLALADRSAIARFYYANRYHATSGVTVIPSAYRGASVPMRGIANRHYIAQTIFRTRARDLASAMRIPYACAATVMRRKAKTS